MQQKDNDQFSFINEKIKEKPVNKKRLLMQAGFIALMAVVFGIIASLVFAYFQPKFESLFYPEEEPVVTIPQDSVAVTELTEETETSEETQPVESEPVQVTETQESQISTETESIPVSSIGNGDLVGMDGCSKRSKPFCRDRDGGQERHGLVQQFLREQRTGIRHYHCRQRSGTSDLNGAQGHLRCTGGLCYFHQ